LTTSGSDNSGQPDGFEPGQTGAPRILSSGAFGFPRLDFFTVTSTLDIAREHARTGAPHGTLITASHQTEGRGRRGARWRDEPGASALMTFIVRPGARSLATAWRLPFLASLACVRALHDLGYLEARVKWPNDLVISGAKVGGLLVESSGSSEEEPALLLGIGVNIAQESFPDSHEFVVAPTSLRIAARLAGKAEWPNAVQVIAAVVGQLESAWRAHPGGDDLLTEWRRHQITGQIQRGISLAGGNIVTGTYRDVRLSDGAGLIETPDVAGLTAVMPATV
jgi:BirA family transcriptional regulator, biotin operon repressor / biotin---[acetyl-CoA-carboxylase] ligase